jgi:hypothetical protein
MIIMESNASDNATLTLTVTFFMLLTPHFTQCQGALTKMINMAATALDCLLTLPLLALVPHSSSPPASHSSLH